MKRKSIGTNWWHGLGTIKFTRKLTGSRPFLRVVALLAAVLALGALVLTTQAATIARTNSNSGSADNDAIQRSVIFTGSDFVAGSQVNDVNISVTFEKSDDVCGVYNGGSAFNSEIYLFLTSPAGTQVALVEDRIGSAGTGTTNEPTYTGNAYGGEVTVNFDDSAPFVVGGPAPVSGAFRPVQSLAAFRGEDPLGSWILTIGDSAFSDPLCFQEFTLTIDAGQPPAMNDQTFSVPENRPDGSTVGTVLATDPDSDDKLTFAITAGDPGDVFTINSNTGEITVADGSQLDYETTTSYSLTVTVTDSMLLTDTATITIYVLDENESAPVVNDQTFTIAENSANGTAAGTVLATDPDIGDTLSYAIIAGDPGGVFAINSSTGEITVADGSQLDYETTTSYSLTVEVTDSALNSTVATITINVTNVNEPPVASDDSFNIAENSTNGTSVGTVSATDPDIGDTLSYAIIAGDPGGVFAINSSTGEITVADGTQLDYDVTNSYSLTVQVTDSGTLSDTATITINVTDVNEPPVVGSQSFSVTENSANGTSVGTVLATDPDIGDTLSYAIIAGDPGGVFAINSSTGEITVADDSQLDYETTTSYSLTVEVTDTAPQSATATITITVTNVNEFAPVVDDQGFAILENSATGASVGIVLATDGDGADTLAFAITTGDPGGVFAINSNTGEITVADGSQLDYETTTSYALTVQVTDSGALSDTAIITIDVIEVNESPSAADDTNTTGEDIPISEPVPGVLDNDDDPENDTLVVTAYDAVSARGAAVTVNPNGSYSYDPTMAPALQALALGESVVDTFSYTVGDGHGNSDTATVHITVNGANDAPTAVDDITSTPEDTPVTILALINDLDIDDDTLSITGVGTPSSGTATTDGATILYTPAQHFSGTATFTYDMADVHGSTDSATVTVNVGATNDPPVANDDSGATGEDTALTVPAAAGLLNNDTDPDPGDTLAVVTYDETSASGAAVTVNPDGSYTYDPTLAPALQALKAAEILVDTFSYTASDSGGLQDTATVSITITGVNDPPLAVDDTDSTKPATPVTINVLDNDSDLDGDALSLSQVTQGSNGTVANNGNGTVTYTPDPGFSGVDTFTYTISDGQGGSDTATVTINVAEHQIFLPLVVNNILSAPDLVVTSVRAGSQDIEVVIKNQGSAPVNDAFWVDFYVDPNPIPSGANQLWQDVSAQGIVWGVTVPLAPGETLVLTYSSAPGAPNLYYSDEHSSFSGSLPAGTPLYAQVDSAHLHTLHGGVLESHELTGGPYNNVSSQATAGN